MKCANEFCDNELRHQRADARFCSTGCRSEARNLRALREGRAIPGYATLDAYLNRRRRRANRSAVGAH
jgi:uncharacterized membrane-anchored protein